MNDWHGHSDTSFIAYHAVFDDGRLREFAMDVQASGRTGFKLASRDPETWHDRANGGCCRGWLLPQTHLEYGRGLAGRSGVVGSARMRKSQTFVITIVHALRTDCRAGRFPAGEAVPRSVARRARAPGWAAFYVGHKAEHGAVEAVGRGGSVAAGSD